MAVFCVEGASVLGAGVVRDGVMGGWVVDAVVQVASWAGFGADRANVFVAALEGDRVVGARIVGAGVEGVGVSGVDVEGVIVLRDGVV